MGPLIFMACLSIASGLLTLVVLFLDGNRSPASQVRTMWTRKEAIRFVRLLSKSVAPVGYHIGLAGSVLVKGRSDNDLDVILYPHSTAKADQTALEDALVRFGLRRVISRDRVRKKWRKKGSLDDKWVEVWKYDHKKVDLFFLR